VPQATDITALLSSGGAGMAVTGKRERIDQKMRTCACPKSSSLALLWMKWWSSCG